MEEWKDIKGYEGIYQVSNLGRVKSLSRIVPFRNSSKRIKECIMQGQLDHNGYLQVSLSRHSKTIHKLVAEAFIPNPTNLPQVNHKDENKQNNSVNNLEWCDNTYNVNYGNRNNIASNKLKGIKHTWKYKSILQFTLDNNLVKEFNSLYEAANKYNVTVTAISNCCKGKSKSSAGFIWKYKQ